MRAAGLYATPLFSDGIGNSIIPDSVIEERFTRDTVTVTMPISPDLTLLASLPLSETTELEIAAGYTLTSIDVSQGDGSRDAGGVAVGHALLAVRKPVRGFMARGGIGAMWFHGSELTAIREMRGLNPLVEAGISRRWTRAGFDIEAGLVGQGAQVSSAAVEARQGPAGMVYRVGLELGIARRFGR